MKTINCDCLIIGGGIQGLMLLNLLQEAGVQSLALVTDQPLGEGESNHTHGYYNRGYFNSLVSTVESSHWWDHFFKQHHDKCGKKDNAYVIANESDAQHLKSIWQAKSLPYQSLEKIPASLQSLGCELKPQQQLFSVQEGTINGCAIITVLAQPYRKQIVHARVQKLIYSEEQNTIMQAEINTSKGTFLIKSKHYFLCAGRNNQLLTTMLTQAHHLRKNLVPNTVRFIPMLLLKGKSPDLTGVYLSYGLTMATTYDEEKQPVTIISYIKGLSSTHELVALGEKITDDAQLVYQCVTQFKKLFPQFKFDNNDYQLAYFTGPKIDSPADNNEIMNNDCYIDDLGINNFDFIWPGLFTNSYYAATELIKKYRTAGASWLVTPAKKLFNAADEQLPLQQEIAKEYRSPGKLEWYSWNDFCKKYPILLGK
ncbi:MULTISPECIES: FAD-dependent oxidoreductase [unclassified Legionella]|uniref:FAD-dependent oxidoreductase n=1 Tax=unclassified Legionella TaxID=2622702 RepID=UPI001E56CE82|nr:FAD-dependent oxidoreductase [Legionella sp. 31fI33]MCC5015238.1 FAD-binding oxidoreductase [Legionella sp. 31fI33]